MGSIKLLPRIGTGAGVFRFVLISAVGVLTAGVATVLSFRQWFWGIALILSGQYAYRLANKTLREMRLVFCRHRILKISTQMYQEDVTDFVPIPRFREFLWVKDLREFEEVTVEQYTAIQKKEYTRRKQLQELNDLEECSRPKRKDAVWLL